MNQITLDTQSLSVCRLITKVVKQFVTEDENSVTFLKSTNGRRLFRRQKWNYSNASQQFISYCPGRNGPSSLLSVIKFCVHWAMLECFLRLLPISILDIGIESSLDQPSIIVRFSADCLLCPSLVGRHLGTSNFLQCRQTYTDLPPIIDRRYKQIGLSGDFDKSAGGRPTVNGVHLIYRWPGRRRHSIELKQCPRGFR